MADNGLLLGLAFLRALFYNPYKDHHFLATGATHDTIAQARDALDAERALLDEIKTHFGASHLELSSAIEQRNWEDMDAGQGFKLYFEKDAQPPGWYRAESWGDRQTYFETTLFMPPAGSEAREYLAQARARFDAIMAGPPGGPDPNEFQEIAARHTGGWHYWNTRVKNALNAPDSFYVMEPPAPGIFIVNVRSMDENYALPENISGLRISADDAKVLTADPAQATRHAHRLEQGKKALNPVERLERTFVTPVVNALTHRHS